MGFPESPSDDDGGEVVIGYPPCSNPHHHQVVIQCPVAAEEAASNNNGQQSSRQQQNNKAKAKAKAKTKEAATNNISESTPLIPPRSAADAAQEDEFRCPAWFAITYAIAFCALYFSYVSGVSIFRQPYVSIESMSFTVVDIASFDNKVTSNLEVVFLIDNNDYGNTTYHHIDIKAYHLDGVGGHFIMPQPNLIATVKAEPFNFNLHGQEKSRVHGRMDGVVVEVDEYQEHVYHEKYGVSYLRLEFSGFARTPYNWLFGSTQIMAACNELKVVFPWNQTRMIEFQPPEECDDDGNFNTFIVPLVLIVLFIFLVVSCFLAFCGC